MLMRTSWLSCRIGQVRMLFTITPPDLNSIEYGYTPSLPTNRNLDKLLKCHFQLKRADCYLTNLFPFVKDGNLSASIKWQDLRTCAETFTLREIEIVAPKMVICLGKNTFLALREAAGHPGNLKLADAIDNPFCLDNASVHCMAHTGARGRNNRSREQVEKDWGKLANIYKLKKPGWDAQAIHKIAKDKFGGLKEMFEYHGWPERGSEMMTSVSTHVVDRYQSVENFRREIGKFVLKPQGDQKE